MKKWCKSYLEKKRTIKAYLIRFKGTNENYK